MVTEKIDGTNAQIYVPADPEHPVLAGSRTRWLIDGATNFAFERWVAEHQTALRRLGPGRHYGEWYGAGVQRRYGLDHKRFALFNAGRWALNPETGKGGLPEGLPVELGVVPILYRGVFSSRKVDETIAKLYREGSIAVPGWRGPGKEGPEGVVVQVDGCRPWKLTDNGDAKKGRAHHVDAAAGAVSVDREWCDGGGAWTRVIGSNILGQDVVELLDEEATDEAIRAAIMTVANKIVTADAAILDARKAVQS
jgi:hypothetical protein